MKIINTNIFFLIIITIIVFLLYGKSINYAILFLDDERSINNYTNFISNVKNIPELFIKDCYYQNGVKEAYYRPLLALTFAIETVLFGQNTKVNHTTNIILFILCIYLMYVFLLELNLNKVILKFVLLLALVHPVFTSNVVYVSPRGESLLAIFTILSLLNIKQYSCCYKTKNLILILLFFALSLFTKESGIVLIIIIPLFLYSLDKLKNQKNLPLFFLALLIAFLYLYLRSFAVSIGSMYIYVQKISFIFKNVINGFVVYINKLLIPSDVPVIIYNYVPDGFSIIVFVIFITLLFIIYLKQIVNRKIILFGISIFVLYLLPTFIMLENQIFFHRLLLPSLGLILIFILFIQKILELYPISKKYFLFLFIILFLIFSYGSYIQADKYKNNKIFILNGYRDAPTYHIFVRGIGELYLEKGDYDKALEFLYLAEKYKPTYYLNDIAAILCYQKKFDEAENLLKQLESSSRHKEIIYANLSLIYEQKQDYKTALEYGEKAYRQNPYNIDLSVNLARQYYLNGRYQQALDIYFELLKFNKKEHQYYYNIALLYGNLKDKQKALEYINKAITLNKNNEKYRHFLSEISDK